MFLKEETLEELEELFVAKGMKNLQPRVAAMTFALVGEEFARQYITEGPKITKESWEAEEGCVERLIKKHYPDITPKALETFVGIVQPGNTTAVGPGEIAIVIFGQCSFSKKADFIWDDGDTVEMKSDGGRLWGQDDGIDTSKLCENFSSFCKRYTQHKVPTNGVGGPQTWGEIIKDISKSGKDVIYEMFRTYYKSYYNSDNVNDEWVRWATDYLLSTPKFREEWGPRKGTVYKPICTTKAWGEPWQFCCGIIQHYNYLQISNPSYFVTNSGDKSLFLNNKSLSLVELIRKVDRKVKYVGRVSKKGSQDKALQIKLV